ncbi:hypothetical protein SSX86_008926 [Deinandra increscens subsp. villosa]|uniref:Oil body-associated protein 1A n=1 Tax=Deinandra increscens subsp. villosa TaxID=3103831 RepID=A0AAP0H5H8_9ASTR
MDPVHATIHPEVPGEKTKIGTSLVDTAASAIQSFGPTKQIHQHLCAFHFYADDMTRQVEAHHYCGHRNDEMRQCLIYDSPDADARLIGLEYIVTEDLFLTLPDSEKPLWHSHEYEVKSGVLFLPGVPGPVERKDLEKVAKTYGKTIHFWQVDKGDDLPLGLPQVMMALTRDGQLYPSLAKDTSSPNFTSQTGTDWANRASSKKTKKSFHVRTQNTRFKLGLFGQTGPMWRLGIVSPSKRRGRTGHIWRV